MKYHTQAFRHNPEAGVYGDCHRTALACILDLERDDVPHFYEGGCDSSEFNRRCKEWLASQGLAEFKMVFNGELEGVLRTMKNVNPGVIYLLGCNSKNGCGHTVICKDDAILHDTSQDQSGVAGPMDDGYWWVDTLVPLKFLQE
ncbi:hypothetical protein Lumi_071 [Xylophilus phage Lumi]|nr:hypothetical protein Lumi_071 [Xylophilus phage Lumi]